MWGEVGVVRKGMSYECATPLYRVLKFSNAEVDVDVKLCYTPLPSFSVNTLNGFPPVSKDTGEYQCGCGFLSCDVVCAVCGVLSVHVHRGQDLMACDSKGLSDPYCTVHANKRKVSVPILPPYPYPSSYPCPPTPTPYPCPSSYPCPPTPAPLPLPPYPCPPTPAPLPLPPYPCPSSYPLGYLLPYPPSDPVHTPCAQHTGPMLGEGSGDICGRCHTGMLHVFVM